MATLNNSTVMMMMLAIDLMRYIYSKDDDDHGMRSIYSKDDDDDGMRYIYTYIYIYTVSYFRLALLTSSL